MDLHLSGKTAVVTGASKGIGLAITRALVDAGAYVVAGSRTRGTELEGLEDAGQVTFVPADLATPQGASDLVATAADRGGIDVLINNAGSLTVHPAGFASMTDEDWQASWNLNVMGTVRPTRAALPQMYRRGGGSIVIVGSMRAYYPDSAYYDYCATKAAVTNIAKSLSNELGPRIFASTPSAPGRCRPRCGSARTDSPMRRPTAAAGPLTKSWHRPSAALRPVGSPRQRKSPTWSSSWPATAPPIPPGLT
jgi:NAD(P)-dependent dehydrogenase (short-subunit alcohol dehydrogenase family)